MSLNLIQSKGRQDNSSVIELIESENSALKQENNLLKERIETLTFSVSALNNKVKTANQEKESLLTVIRLLNEDIQMKSPVGSQQLDKNPLKNSEDFQTRKKIPNKRGTAKDPAILTTVNSNRFTVLQVHETSEDDDEVIEIDTATKPNQGMPDPRQMLRPGEINHICPKTNKALNTKVKIMKADPKKMRRSWEIQ